MVKIITSFFVVLLASFAFSAYSKPVSRDYSTIYIDGVHYAFNETGWQKAVDDLPSTGGKIFIPCSTSTFKNPVIIVKSNVTIEGEGQCTEIFQADGTNEDMIRVGDAVTPVNNVHIKNLAIDGNRVNNTGACDFDAACTRNLIRFRSDKQNSYFSSVDNVWLKNGPQNGLSIESHAFISVTNITSENNGNFGVWSENGSNVNIGPGVWTRNNEMAGIKVLSSGGVSIVGVNSKGDNGGGIALQNVSASTITSNVIYRTGWQGVVSTPSTGISMSNVKSSTIGDNTIFGAYGHGMTITGSKNNSIANNAFRMNGQQTNDTYSDILLRNSGGANSGNIFTENTFDNSTQPYFSNKTKYNMSAETAVHWDNIIKDNVFGDPVTSFAHNLSNSGGYKNMPDNNWGHNVGLNPHQYVSYQYCAQNQHLSYADGDYLQCAGYSGTTNITIDDGFYRGQEVTFQFDQDGGNKKLSWPANVKVPLDFAPDLTKGETQVVVLLWNGNYWIFKSY